MGPRLGILHTAGEGHGVGGTEDWVMREEDGSESGWEGISGPWSGSRRTWKTGSRGSRDGVEWED